MSSRWDRVGDGKRQVRLHSVQLFERGDGVGRQATEDLVVDVGVDGGSVHPGAFVKRIGDRVADVDWIGAGIRLHHAKVLAKQSLTQRKSKPTGHVLLFVHRRFDKLDILSKKKS